jgi:ElaB/YqjD/DUF883 family membrane-anchored ribosome-binding protein
MGGVARSELSRSEINKETAISDIKTIFADTEDLLKQAANATSERTSELRETALTRLKQAKEKAASVQVIVVEKSRKAAQFCAETFPDGGCTHLVASNCSRAVL